MKQRFKPDLYLYSISLWVALSFFYTSVLYAGFVIGKINNGHFIKDLLILSGILCVGFGWHFFERVFMAPYIEDNYLMLPRVFKKIQIPILSIKTLEYTQHIGSQYIKLTYLQNNIELKQFIRIHDYNTQTIKDFESALTKVHQAIQVKTSAESQKFFERRAQTHLKTPTSLGSWILFALSWIIPIALATYIFLLIIA